MISRRTQALMVIPASFMAALYVVMTGLALSTLGPLIAGASLLLMLVAVDGMRNKYSIFAAIMVVFASVAYTHVAILTGLLWISLAANVLSAFVWYGYVSSGDNL